MTVWKFFFTAIAAWSNASSTSDSRRILLLLLPAGTHRPGDRLLGFEAIAVRAALLRLDERWNTWFRTACR